MSWIKRGSTRKAVVRLLAKKPRTKSEIATAMRVSWDWVSLNVQLLERRGLVQKLTSPSVRRGKVYGLTPLGRQIAKNV